MTLIAWFDIVTGTAIVAVWTVLLWKRQVPEIEEGDRAIWFHIAAESLLGLALVAAGMSLLMVDESWARLLAGVAAGGLAYSTINSSGYYAKSGQWAVVAVFGLLTIAAVGTIIGLLSP